MRTLAIALTLLLFAPLVHAQDAPPVDSPIVIEHLDFKGGTLAQFVEALREGLDHAPVNVLLRNDAGNVRIPTLELRDVSLDTALRAAVPIGQRETRQPDGSLLVQWTFLDRTEVNDRGSPVYVFDAGSEVQKPPAGDGERRFEVFGLGRVIGDGDADGVLEIIDAAMSLDDAEPAELRYHKDSGLLIVRGTHEQLVLVDQVIGRLEADRSRTSDEDRDRAEHIADLEFGLERAQTDLETAARHLEAVERQRDRTADLVKRQFAGEEQLENIEMEVIDRRAEVQRAEAEVRHMKQKLDLARLDAADTAAGLPRGLNPADLNKPIAERIRILEKEIATLRSTQKKQGEGSGESAH